MFTGDILFLIPVVSTAIIVFILKEYLYRRQQHHRHEAHCIEEISYSGSGEEILKQRLAMGKITGAEYTSRMARL